MSSTARSVSLNVTNLPERTSTVEDFIDMGASDQITYKNFSILVKFVSESSVVEYAQDNIIYDYMDEIMERTVDYEFSDLEYIKYRYKPKLLAYDIYDTTELFFVILAINGMCSVKDFTKRKIKLLYKSDMLDLLNQIYSAESDYILYNQKHVQTTDYSIDVK